MRNENILIFLEKNKFYFYNIKTKKEIIEEVDMTSFFEFGEIKSVNKFQEYIKSFLDKYNIASFLKPNISVLYNDVSYSDQESLYKLVLNEFNYSNISFIKMRKIVSKEDNFERIIYFDGDIYTSFNLGIKQFSLDFINFEPIIIGEKLDGYIHYSDKQILWNLFKSHFTK